mgnify:CR=1 FL=1
MDQDYLLIHYNQQFSMNNKLRWLTAPELDAAVIADRSKEQFVSPDSRYKYPYITINEQERLRLLEGRDLTETEIATIHNVYGHVEPDGWKTRIPIWCFTDNPLPGWIWRLMTKEEAILRHGEDWRFKSLDTSYVFRPEWDAVLGTDVDLTDQENDNPMLTLKLPGHELWVRVPRSLLIKQFVWKP